MTTNKQVVVITPVHQEPLDMLQKLADKMAKIIQAFKHHEVQLKWCLAVDHSTTKLPRSKVAKVLFRNGKNEGLSNTMLRAYCQAKRLYPKADIVVKMDANEHDPMYLFDIVSKLQQDGSSPIEDISAVFIPVRLPDPSKFSVKDETDFCIRGFQNALQARDYESVAAYFDNTLLVGYQAFRAKLLWGMLDDLRLGLNLYRDYSGQPSLWWIDILTIILARHYAKGNCDLMFGGYSADWEESRSEEKKSLQRGERAMMVRIANFLTKKV